MDLAIFKIDLKIRVRCSPKRDHWKIAVAELRSVEELKRLLERAGKGDAAEDIAGEVLRRGSDVVRGAEIDEPILEEFGFRMET